MRRIQQCAVAVLPLDFLQKNLRNLKSTIINDKINIMTNLITKTTEFAMFVTRDYIRPGDTVVDATCGTGRDTLALAEAVGENGSVIAFDIQDEALRLTGERIEKHGLTNVHLIKESFENMNDYLPCGVSAVVFNLGYLPGGDHSITTTADKTTAGLCEALKALKPGGIITVVMYDGHPEGRSEKQAVINWASALDPKAFHAAFVNMLNQNNNPPEIIFVTRKI